jgi:hypothetical protein
LIQRQKWNIGGGEGGIFQAREGTSLYQTKEKQGHGVLLGPTSSCYFHKLRKILIPLRLFSTPIFFAVKNNI